MRRLLLLVLGLAVLPVTPAAVAADACLLVLECEAPAPSTTTSTTVPVTVPPTTVPVTVPPPAPAVDPAVELLDLANAARAAAGLAPLRASGDAAAVARAWSGAMASTGVLAHNDGWFTPAVRSRLGARRLGENVAYAGSVAHAHATLLASPGHRANLLDPGFSVVGMAAVEHDGLWWVTQDFAEVTVTTVASATPAPTPPSGDPIRPEVVVSGRENEVVAGGGSADAARWVARAAAQRSWDSAASSIRWR